MGPTEDTASKRAATSAGGRAVPFVPLASLIESPDALVVDLRAPIEHGDDRIPGAVNVPLFENETRSFVGLLYKQFSPEAAFQEGRAAVAGRIDELVREVSDAAGWEAPCGDDLVRRVLDMTSDGIERMERDLSIERLEELAASPVVFACARGGLRSRSVVALMRALGFDRAVGLEGGYRAWRQHVMQTLADWTPPSRVVSLRGLTGVGKTLVLREIEARRPGWTLDLEGIAGHRSSLLGMVGLQPVSQKAFETGLATRTAAGFPGDVMVVEGESRKVGDAVIPRAIWDAMGDATNVHVTASVARRVDVLTADYLADPSALPKLRAQLVQVAARMPGQPDLAGWLDRGDTTRLVEELLEHYYDPLYRGSESGKQYDLEVDATSSEAAAESIIAWIESGVGVRS